MPSLYWLIFGIIFALVMLAVGVALAFIETKQKSGLFRRLGKSRVTRVAANVPSIPVLIETTPQRKQSEWRRLTGIAFLARQLGAADLEWNPDIMAVAMIALATAGALVGMYWRVLIYAWASSVGLAAVLALLPYLYVVRKKNARLNAFQSQFPDTLDFLARALRGGHAVSISLELLANESPEPTRKVFRRVFTEHSLGAPIEVALKGLVERVPLVDVRFFVAAVLLQRETGGNLSEILDNLADVMRDRFQLKAHIRAASAHGRMTALALTFIPVAVVILLSFMSPGYLEKMSNDPHGRMMLLGSMVGQVVGYIAMKKIVNIKV